ncbi:MAG: hypothetical protein A2X02_08095 [Bacteroidetes bacterium GWF2_29_10]|nr:MAG: hypothetical protein A2X02_08095 [Bacteroidetes bacterium GWF2_29_10]
MKISKYLKILSIVLISYSILAGLNISVPDIPVIKQTIRNLFFHVNMWIAMFTLFITSFIYAIKLIVAFDSKSNIENNYDIISYSAAKAGLLFGLIGIITGMIWAKFTWGVFWLNDAKLNGAVISIFSYVVYFIIRANIKNEMQKQLVASVYNIICFIIIIIFIIVYPRIGGESIHPGSTGIPIVFANGMSSNLRLIFYPAIIGWLLFALWIAEIYSSIIILQNKIDLEISSNYNDDNF